MDKLLNTEYALAAKLLNVSKVSNSKINSFFLISEERLELLKACVDVKTLFHWNFKFQEFYEVIINHNPVPVEFYWILHVYQIMPFETYILSFYSQSSNQEKFTETFLKLCMEDLEANDAQYFTQTGILSYFIGKAFPVIEITGDKKIKEICLEFLRSFLQDIFSTVEDEIKNKRFSCFFALWVTGLLDEKSLFYFCSFALDFYLNFHPTVNDIDVFELLVHSHSNASPYHLLTVIEKLVKFQKSDRIIHFLKSAVQKNQINTEALLVIVKAYLETHEDASISTTNLVSELMNEAYDKSSYKILMKSLFIGYQASYLPNISPYVHYRVWLQAVFRECSNSRDFSLLTQVLSDLVPFYKDIEYLRVAIDSNFCIPSEVQSIYDDYIILLKTRFQDLKPPSKQELTVEKALLLFESLGKIPPVVLEISLLQKHFYLNEFLPALLVPRIVPPVSDTRERFIEALHKAGKISSSMLQKYKDSCLEKPNNMIEDINMVDCFDG